jgi:hypothetical protein
MTPKFFVEDKAHVKFLIDFVAERFNIQLSDTDFYKLNSWAGYKEGGIAFPDYGQNTENGIVNITILDADVNAESRRNEVISDFASLGINSHLFLFPNDNAAGELEIALAEIAVDRKIISCFEAYEKCIEGYEKPVNKSKIFAYLDAVLEPKYKKNNRRDLIQEQNRNYRNLAHWNLHHDYLNPLYNFLAPLL